MRTQAEAIDVLHVFPSFVPAGSQVRTARILGALGSAWRHAVLALDGRLDARALVESAVDVRYLAAPPKAGSAATTLRLAQVLERERPRLLCTYNFGSVDAGLAALSLGGVPHVHHEDGFLPDEARGQMLRRTLMRRIALVRTSRVVVISNTLLQIALQTWRLDPDQVQLIPNGIDLERFAPRTRDVSVRARLGIGSEAFLVGAVGHLRPEKNFARLLHAASHLPQAHVLILGEGGERARLEQLASSLGMHGRVHLPGYDSDPRGYYGAMDVFVISSDTEQTPLALLEAMAMGLPAVGTGVGDVASILGPAASDWIVPLALGPQDRASAPCSESDVVANMAGRLQLLARDGDLRQDLGAKARQTVQARFDERDMLRAYRHLFERAVGL